MKTTLVFLTLLFLSAPSIRCFAESVEETTENSVVILTPVKPKYPRAPSSIFLECRYSAGHLAFTIPDDVEFISITIGEEESPLWTGIVTKQMPETDIPLLIGTFPISCRTDGNQIFYGELTF